jgi:hypothetical protein
VRRELSIVFACGLAVASAAGCATRPPARAVGIGLLALGAGLVLGGIATYPEERNLGTLGEEKESLVFVFYGTQAVIGGAMTVIFNELRELDSEKRRP